jgi:hypothetical protein
MMSLEAVFQCDLGRCLWGCITRGDEPWNVVLIVAHLWLEVGRLKTLAPIIREPA